MKFFRKLRRKKAEKIYEDLADAYLKANKVSKPDKFIPFEVDREENIAYFIVPVVITQGEILDFCVTNEYLSIMMKGMMTNSCYIPDEMPMIMVSKPNTSNRDLRIGGKIVIKGVSLFSNIYNFYSDLGKSCTGDINKQVCILYAKIPYYYAVDSIDIDHIQLYEYCNTADNLVIERMASSILPDVINITIDAIEVKKEDFKIEGTTIIDHRTGDPRNVIYITYGFGSKICPCNVAILLDDLYDHCRDICKTYGLINNI